MAQPEYDDLERRISNIERYLGMEVGQPVGPAAEEPRAEQPARDNPEALLPAIGRALLGLAGAYLLRALTETSTVSARAGVAAGIVYAILWLVWAARTPAGRRVETALHSLTAVLVLSPLLWEAVTRFQAVGTWTAGGILVFFTLFGLAVSWRKHLLIVATIVTLAGLGTAAALLIATHDDVPFTLVFLGIAAAVEISACCEHWLSERWLAAAAADLAVVLATWLVTNERGLPPAYTPIPVAWLVGMQVGLLAIYLASTIVRTIFRGFTFTAFETAQCAAAFAISVGGGLRLASQTATIGILALACAAACYLVSFMRLEGKGGRNFYTYSTFGILLALVGSRIVFSTGYATALWAILSVAAIWMGGASGRLTLEVHGCVYLLLAAGISGALARSAGYLLETDLWGRHGGIVDVYVIAALAGYVLAMHYGRAGKRTWNFQAVRLALAATAAWLVAGILAGVLTAAYHGIFGADASHAYCATLRTGVLAGVALLFAWAGARWRNVELSRLVYPAMVLGAYRLLAEDLHQDRKAALFLSLLVYGAVLMLLPRVKKATSAAGS